jgi:hypothetical protein
MSSLVSSCGHCRHRHICLPIAVNVDALQALDAIVEHQDPIQAGKPLFASGETFTSFIRHSFRLH